MLKTLWTKPPAWSRIRGRARSTRTRRHQRRRAVTMLRCALIIPALLLASTQPADTSPAHICSPAYLSRSC